MRDPKYFNLLSHAQQLSKHNLNVCVAEPKKDYAFLKERHLQVMWLEQKYFRSLKTSEGLPIEIISPGIWNSEAGPDFLKAHIKIGEREFRGDIELHLAEEGWFQHHHHLDEKYCNVVLHISYWKPQKERLIFTLDGKLVARASFENCLTIPEARIVKFIDLELYPYQHFSGSGHCGRILFRSEPKDKIIHFFRSAALWRLAQKKQYLAAKVDKASDYLAAGMAMGLGYKYNAEAFLDLFLKLKINGDIVRDETAMFSLALGLCGFFKEAYQEKWHRSAYYHTLFANFKSLPEEIKQTPMIALKGDRIRPSNHPIRRLAILSKIALDNSLSQRFLEMIAAWQGNWQKASKPRDWTALRRLLLGIFPVYRDSYWENHFVFEKKIPRRTSLIGEDLRKEMFINVCLPLLYDDIEKRNNPLELEAFQNFFSSFPASKTKKSLYLSHRFFGESKKVSLFDKAEMQQGAYQLHRDFCIHFEASCLGCPFVESYLATFGNQS